MKQTLPALLMVSAGAVGTGGGLVASTHETALAAAQKSTTQKFRGPLVDMRWGPVRATIYVKSKKITKVSISTSPENDRSQFIDDQAVPMLKDETLKAQNANIDLIGGATMTSEAYLESLQVAVKNAKHHKALK
jgi:uncharacterized protein with FMN-binding domain